MTGILTARRYRATTLTDVIDAQGRRRDWVAERAGITPPQLSHVERGRRTVTQEVAERIAAALQVPVLAIFDSADAADSYAGEKAA